MAVHAQTTCTLSTIPAKTSLLKGHFLYSDGYANVIENVANSPTGWGSNVHIGANGIQLRYNNVILSEWAAKTITPTSGANISPNFTFYYPEESSSGVVRQGISALKITTDGLTLYKNTIERVEENRIAAQLNSNGLTVKKGGIKGGTPGYNEFIYLSTENFSDIINNHAAGQISIDGYIKNNWRQIIGNRFAVDSEGYLYADSAILSGQAIAQAGFEVRTQLNDYNSRVAVFNRNIQLGDFLYIRNLSGSNGRAYVSDFTTLPYNENSYSFTLTYPCLIMDPEDVQVIAMVPFVEEGEEIDSSYYNIISGSITDYNMYKDSIVFNSSAIGEWGGVNIEIRYYTNSPYARTFTFGTRGEVTYYDYIHIEEDECRPHYDPNYPTGALTTTFGVDCIAEGFCSIAIGEGSSSIGRASFSLGTKNTVKGNNSFAIGNYCNVFDNNKTIIKNNSIELNGNTDVYGDVNITKSGAKYKINGTALSASDVGALPTRPTSIEFQPSSSTSNNGGFIDFHYNRSTADYTSRIIESASGVLTITGGLRINNHSSNIGTVKVANASAKTVNNNTNTNLTSISLEAGTWVITGGVRFPANATGYRRMNISTTSAAGAADVQLPAVNGASTQLAYTLVVSPTATTTYYLNCYQNSGANLSLIAGGDENGINFIRAVRIA